MEKKLGVLLWFALDPSGVPRVMVRRYVSLQGQAFFGLSFHLRTKLREKLLDMDRPTRNAFFEVLVRSIHELDALLRHPSVRGHLDPSILTPEVDVRSSLKAVLRRLKRQFRAASILADAAHLGPPANEEEQAAVSGVDRVIYALYDEFLPFDGSTTESD
ncbi:unnamed protein product [Caenorhabditis auriculariae]|uniref:Uncharacterized protein n=1 Tax=Caenorhabditis auriculariae TaxID=2777116 RepID=A0A8S1HRC9_9PELO|nr:unnamed protein product [Caenorhabditis auriculariae]